MICFCFHASVQIPRSHLYYNIRISRYLTNLGELLIQCIYRPIVFFRLDKDPFLPVDTHFRTHIITSASKRTFESGLGQCGN